MNQNKVKETVVKSLSLVDEDISLFDDFNFCLFNAKDLNSNESNRLKDITSVDDIKKMGLLTQDLDTFVDYAKSAHNDNSDMLYGAIGSLGDAYFICIFLFKIKPNKKNKMVKGMHIVPWLKFSPDWLSEYFFDDAHKISIKDILIKVKLNSFLNE